MPSVDQLISFQLTKFRQTLKTVSVKKDKHRFAE